MNRRPRRNLLAALGPGFLFAGAAVGVSHLVQATRAGAQMGLALVGVIVAALVVKYVPFSFGPRYAAATGTSLLEGYRRRGRWALALYAVLTAGTMFTIQGAVTLVTAALARAVLHIDASPVVLAVGLTALCLGLLATGGYRWLDRIMKFVVSGLAIMTLVAAALVTTRVDFGTFRVIPPVGEMTPAAIFFLAALVGWMPSAIDISVWHSLWVLARRKETGVCSADEGTVRDCLLDFDVGYVLTGVLALCFVLLGAGVVFGSGEAIAGSSVAFADQIIRLYTESLGDWARYLIGPCALLVMLSTTLAVIDAFPRAITTVIARFSSPEEAGSVAGGRWGYWAAAAALALGSFALIAFFADALKPLVDLATTLSFLTAPVLSWLNHRAVLGDEVPPAARPGRTMVLVSWASIFIQAVFALWFLWIRFLA